MEGRPVARYRMDFAHRYRPNETFYLTDADRAELEKAGTPIIPPLFGNPAVTYARRVLEELEIDMSWASSWLEGNSYDIFDTDRLVRSARRAAGKPRRDATMILNHKNAIRYVVENLAELDVCATDIRCIHALLANQLISDPTLMGGLRRAPVSISRSNYVPLEDRFTLRKEFHTLVSKAARITNPFEQSFFMLVHIPYLHPFAHMNKRTSRIASIIPLLKADLAPMSFFAINDRDYIRGLVGVYELNDVSLLREAFVNGYLASARRYRYVRPQVINPEKGGLEYRRFATRAIRRCVLKWKAFKKRRIRRMMDDADIPPEDRDELLDLLRHDFEGLHEGNVVIFALKPEDLKGLKGLRVEPPCGE